MRSLESWPPQPRRSALAGGGEGGSWDLGLLPTLPGTCPAVFSCHSTESGAAGVCESWLVGLASPGFFGASGLFFLGEGACVGPAA